MLDVFFNFLNSFSFNYFILFFLFLIFFLLFLLMFFQVKNNRKLNSLAYPAYEYILNKAQAKANNIIRNAVNDSRKMRVNAELAGIKAIAKKKLKGQEIEEEYQKILEELTKNAKELANSQSSELEQKYNQLVEDFKVNLKQESDFAEEKIKQVVNEIDLIGANIQEKTKNIEDKYEEFASGLDKFLNKQSQEVEKILNHKLDDFDSKVGKSLSLIEDKIKKSESEYNNLISLLTNKTERQLSKHEKTLSQKVEKISEELDNFSSNLAQEIKKEINTHLSHRFEEANEIIETYRRERIRLINERIIALVERATQIAINKKMSVEEQTDLIYKALEEAKKEGIFN